jgi:hypothetical protein
MIDSPGFHMTVGDCPGFHMTVGDNRPTAGQDSCCWKMYVSERFWQMNIRWHPFEILRLVFCILYYRGVNWSKVAIIFLKIPFLKCNCKNLNINDHLINCIPKFKFDDTSIYASCVPANISLHYRTSRPSYPRRKHVMYGTHPRSIPP